MASASLVGFRVPG